LNQSLKIQDISLAIETDFRYIFTGKTNDRFLSDKESEVAKIRIIVYDNGQDINGETGIVGIISGNEHEKNGFFFARMVENGGRQHWLGQRFFSDEADALRYWRRHLQSRGSSARA
jgi:hypothetical protein